MPPCVPPSSRRASRAALLSLAVLAMAGCAQQRAPEYYTPRQNQTLNDAQRNAIGREATRAPSQVQIGFGQTAAPAAQPQAEAQPAASGQAPAAPTPRALSEPKTFLGTVPCQAGACRAARIHLTLAPSGQWRARTTPLDGQQSPMTEQGCWTVVGDQPLRILLQLANQTTRANLGFLNDNVVRVHEINGAQPALEYRLTRQAEIDPIQELNASPAPSCQG